MSNASLELGGGKWGTKDGNLLGYASSTSSNKFVSREFTFTRGSDIAATRVNSSGVIEKYRENLLLQSNQFDTSPWVSSSITLTSGQLGYDGSTDAWLLTKNGTGFRNVYQYINELGVATLTVHAKAGSTNWMRLTHGGKTAYFDLSGSGAIGVTSNGIDQTITGVGNGWFKCTLTANRTVAGQVPIYPYTAEGDSSGSTDSIYIQDVQLEKGLVATSYLESGATTATSGVADNEPRINYAGGTASLLLEPSRTNLITQSEYLESPFNSLLTFNSITSPEGLVNAVKIVENTNTNMHGIRKTNIFPTNANAVVYTISVFAKKNQRDFLQIQTYADTTSINSNGFDLTNGTITGDSTNHKIEDYGNGWYRCSFTVSITQSTGGYNFIRIAIGKVNSSFYYTGDNTSGLYLYGFQFEEGSYPTSYIPTYGTSVTRNADFFDSSADFTNFFGNNQGTIYIETDRRLFKGGVNNDTFIGFRENSSGNYWRIIGRDSQVFVQSIGWGNTQIIHYYTSNPTKYLFKWDGTTISFFVEGSLVGSTTQTATFNPDAFGRTGGGVNMASQEFLNQFTLFPTALSDAECITLTT